MRVLTKVGDIQFPLRPYDQFCHTACPIHCHGHNFNEYILTPQNDSFEAILWFCGSQLQKYGELDELITILGWENFWIWQVCFLPFTSKKGFLGWDKFCASGICPRLCNIPNMEDPVAQGKLGSSTTLYTLGSGSGIC